MDSRGRYEDDRGPMIRHGSGWRINNALVEEVSADGAQTGYLIVSYAVRGRGRGRGGRGPWEEWGDRGNRIELLRLNVDRNTIITTRLGRNIGLRRIRPGMRIDAEFSGTMTRSIPPQARAFRITLLTESQVDPPPSRPPVTREQIVRVDYRNSIVITGSRFDINRQMRYIVTDRTVILDRRGRRITLRDLSEGQWVEITYAEVSITIWPRQTTAYRIQLL